MALTLAEAAKLSNDVVQQGVIETVVKESRVLDALPFVDVAGNALTYNRENAMATAAFFDVGDTWTESTPTFTQVSTSLKILGGDADIDQYIATTRSNVQDIEAAVLELKAKAVAHEFEDEFVYGDTASDPKGFDGLHLLCPAGQQIHQGAGATPAALSLKKLDEAIDLVKPGKPDFLLVTRRTRRGISAYARALTSPVSYEAADSAAASCSMTASPSSSLTSWSARRRSLPAPIRPRRAAPRPRFSPSRLARVTWSG